VVGDFVILESGNLVIGKLLILSLESYLILGGAALQRCGDLIVLNAALAAEVSGGDANAS
jgi:hypothetical protein